ISTPLFSISPPFMYGGPAPNVPKMGASTNQSLVVFLYQSKVIPSLDANIRASKPKFNCSEVSQVTSGFVTLSGYAVTPEIGFVSPKKYPGNTYAICDEYMKLGID